MPPTQRARLERAILRALAAAGPLTGAELADRLRAAPGLLAAADGWPRLLTALRAAGRVERTGGGRTARWAAVATGGRRRRPTAGG